MKTSQPQPTEEEAARFRDEAERMRKDQYFADLLHGYRFKVRREVAELVTAYLGEKSIVANCQIINNTLRCTDRGIDIIPHVDLKSPGLAAPKPKRPYRRTEALARVRLYKGRLTAGRRRQIAAVKAYHAKRRAQKAKK